VCFVMIVIKSCVLWLQHAAVMDKLQGTLDDVKTKCAAELRAKQAEIDRCGTCMSLQARVMTD
jgi:hypothetical protein